MQPTSGNTDSANFEYPAILPDLDMLDSIAKKLIDSGSTTRE